MNLRHLLHPHTHVISPAVGDISLCRRRRDRIDAYVRAAGHDWWMCLRDVTPGEVLELVSVNGPDNASVTGGDRLLFVANSIRMRRERAS